VTENRESQMEPVKAYIQESLGISVTQRTAGPPLVGTLVGIGSGLKLWANAQACFAGKKPKCSHAGGLRPAGLDYPDHPPPRQRQGAERRPSHAWDTHGKFTEVRNFVPSVLSA